MTSNETMVDDPVTIRPLGDSDRAAVARLAELDSRALPTGELLGAEVGGRLVAAISLDDEVTVANPFRPTAGVRAMLELRAAQLRVARNGHPGRLPASASGAGGRLLTLLTRT